MRGYGHVKRAKVRETLAVQDELLADFRAQPRAVTIFDPQEDEAA